MTQEKLDMFLTVNAAKFKPSQLNVIKDRLSNASEAQLQQALLLDYKTPITMLIISILVGSLGVDRFMLGQTGLGVAKLLTCGGIGIWTIVDWFSVQDRTKDYNFEMFHSAVK